MEKIENRLERVDDPVETEFLKKCISFMEEEKPLCDMEVSDSEKAILAELAPASYTPTLVLDSEPEDINILIKDSHIDISHKFEPNY